MGRVLFPAAALCAILVLGGAFGAAQGQEAAAPPAAAILTLDDDRLFRESLFGKAVLARQDADTQSLTAENRQIEAQLEAEEKDLTTRRAALTRAQFAPLSEAFNAKVNGIRTAQDSKSRALTRRFEEEKQRFFDAVRPALAQIMQERGASVILDKRAIFVGFDNVDITAAAIAVLDSSLGDGSKPSP